MKSDFLDSKGPKPQCSHCGAKTVYYRAYNGESLCGACFNASIFDKVKRTISKFGMLHFGDRIAVAISGGKDSTSLLYILKEITRGHASELVALTVDEGIEGYRDESVRNAKTFCQSLSVPLLVTSYRELFGLSLDEALKQRDERRVKSTSCALCGPLRRRSIDSAAERLGASVVATAHNLDDLLQTFFINAYSGDVERIRWLDPGFHSPNFRLRRIKPVMEIYEQELAFFAYLNDLPFQSESCPYMNEGIRSEIRLHLNELERKHPGIKYSTLRTVLGISSGLDSDSPQTKRKKVSSCENCGSVSTSRVCSVCAALDLVR